MKTFQITIAMAIATSAASAGIIDMQFTGTGAGSTVQIQVGESNPFNVFAGQLNHEITNAQGVDAYLNGSHQTFCADISEHVSSQGSQYQTTALENIPLTDNNSIPMSSVQANAIRSLYAQNANTLRIGNISNSFGTAMQLTVWEIVSDFDGTAASIDLATGDLIVAGRNGDDLDADIVNYINAFKTQIITGINQRQSVPDQVIGLASAGYQDQLITVPAPGALALFTAGTLLSARRRRC